MFKLGCASSACFKNEILSGLTVALALVPEAVAFAFIAGLSCKHFNTPTIAMIEKHDNLVAYRDRMSQEWFKESD